MISMSEIIVRLKDNRIKITGGEYVRDLVRCKDCKHFAYCENDCCLPENFCSQGEKEDK